jgi:hypothetical protein
MDRWDVPRVVDEPTVADGTSQHTISALHAHPSRTHRFGSVRFDSTRRAGHGTIQLVNVASRTRSSTAVARTAWENDARDLHLDHGRVGPIICDSADCSRQRIRATVVGCEECWDVVVRATCSCRHHWRWDRWVRAEAAAPSVGGGRARGREDVHPPYIQADNQTSDRVDSYVCTCVCNDRARPRGDRHDAMRCTSGCVRRDTQLDATTRQ